jgi:hypothetical protein
MNIGITISLGSENESLWINGIKLNALYLLKALKEIGYNAYLLNASEVKAPYENKVTWDIEQFPIYDYYDKYADTDLMIWLGATYGDKTIEEFKKTGYGKKVVKYICGNNYMNDLEGSMFNSGPNATGYNQLLDEAWYVPQQGELNIEYYRVMHNLPANKVRPVPFIWDPIFLDDTCQVYNNPKTVIENRPIPVYVPGKENKDKQIACFEPNIGTQKWHFINLLIAEDYHNNGGKFKKLNIMCGEDMLKNKYYQSLLTHLSLYKLSGTKDHKLSYLPRLRAIDAMAQLTDIVIAHQYDNPLNYSYLDALYLQFPLVHNATMIKDAGYYYDGNLIGQGSRQLKQAIENHDNNIESYNENSEKVLTRYTVFNDGLIETYKQLIETTMGIKDHKLSAMYDWKTNLYK